MTVRTKRTKKCDESPGDATKPTAVAYLEWLDSITDLSAWPTYPDGDLAIPFVPLSVELTDEVKRRHRGLVARLHVESQRNQYERTGNPVYAWRAYAECRGGHLAIPEWVLKYLDEPAREFWHWSMVGQLPATDNGNGPPMELGEALADALLMSRHGRKGRRNVFADVFPHKKTMALACGAYDRVRQGRKPWYAITDEAEASHVSRSTVQRAWDLHIDEIRAAEDALGIRAPAMFRRSVRPRNADIPRTR